LKEAGKKVVAVRHPMPYGDLTAQRVQRYAELSDLDRYETTIEEREEYEPHITSGTVIYAGVDYGDILTQAQEECDVLLWDGGNNDLPFYRPTVHLALVDPLRPGHETRYHPGEANLRMADIIVVNKMDSATPEQVAQIDETIARLNPTATVVKANSKVTVDDAEAIRGKRVLVVEDGPTLTHGEMPFGAGQVVADRLGAAEVVDPRPYARGSIARLYERWPHLGRALPAMGYFPAQLAELFATIDATDCDTVVIATPIDLRRLGPLRKPSTRVRYRFVEPEPALLAARVRAIAHRGG
jgi:predicted GTPase